MNEFLRRCLLGMVQDQAGEHGGAGGGAGGSAGGAGGVNPNADFQNTDAFKQAVAEAVEAQTAGLKAKRDELITKNNALRDSLKNYDGIDPEAARTLASKAKTEEEAALLKEGKLDQVVERRVDKMREKFNADVAVKEEALQKALARQKQLEDRSIAATIAEAAVKAGGNPTAIPDFVQRANGTFTLTEEGDVICVDKDGYQAYSEDGKTPITAAAWVESLKTQAPHLFVKAQSGGAQGGHGKGSFGTGSIGGNRSEREAYLQHKFNLPNK